MSNVDEGPQALPTTSETVTSPEPTPGPAAAAAPPPPTQQPAPPAPAPLPPPAPPRLLLGRYTWYSVAVVAIMLLAVATRLWALDNRAVHHDESIHMQLSYNFARSGGYTYQPAYHPPFQYMMNALLFRFIDNDYVARLLYALAGIGVVGMPFALRRQLGSLGAVLAAALLAVSPATMYVSRFARNDVYMVLFALGILACAFRYIENGRKRWLYGVSALLALMFVTNETSYLYVGIFGAIFFFMALPQLFGWLLYRVKTRDLRGPAVIFILMFTLTLPQWGALSALVQDRLGVVLAQPNTPNIALDIVGLPKGDGLLYAAGIVTFLLLLSFAIGTLWNWRVWLPAALIFWVIWIVFYSAFFTDPISLPKGIWQGLGYWWAQQDVARGGQPWYYYFIVGGVYEFLPLIVGSLTLVWAFWRGNQLAVFAAAWALFAFIAYTYASEKMPWILINLTAPFILLTAWGVARLVQRVPWDRVRAFGQWPPLAYGGLLAAGAARELYVYVNRYSMGPVDWTIVVLMAALVLALAFFAVFAGARRTALLSVLGVLAAGFLFTCFVALRASFDSVDDRPIEMLVYAQGSIDLNRNMERIEKLAKDSGQGYELPIEIDGDFTWPAVWYLRHYKRVGYPCMKRPGEGGYESYCTPVSDQSTAPVLWVGKDRVPPLNVLPNHERTDIQRATMWFPEEYRNLTPRGLWASVRHRDGWRGPVDYFLIRRLGSAWWASEFRGLYRTDYRP